MKGNKREFAQPYPFEQRPFFKRRAVAQVELAEKVPAIQLDGFPVLFTRADLRRGRMVQYPIIMLPIVKVYLRFVCDPLVTCVWMAGRDDELWRKMRGCIWLT